MKKGNRGRKEGKEEWRRKLKEEDKGTLEYRKSGEGKERRRRNWSRTANKRKWKTS